MVNRNINFIYLINLVLYLTSKDEVMAKFDMQNYLDNE